MEEIKLKLRDGKHVFVQYWDSNCKNTILFLHGGPGQGCWDFEYSAQKLSRNFNIISFDQRGVLRSDAISENDNFSSEDLIDDIEDIRQHFNLKNIILIGHSYGGQLILRYAVKYPKNISRIIYVCPSLNIKFSFENVYSISYNLLIKQGKHDIATSLQNIINNNSASDYIDHFLDIPQDIREKVYYDSELPQKVEQVISKNEIEKGNWSKGSIQQAKILKEPEFKYNYLPLLDKIKIPSLLVLGEYDPISCKKHQKIFLEKAYKAEILEIKNCGHMPYSYNPDEFVDGVCKYLL
ncbi:alpha/beta hydrolase [Sedimentibacter sp. zth1]|uniref:alpha/beta hydrolase n=1 Tax=Sedimentibacter sp. zth1 TaxID=2816908 RepID=UPI001A92DCE8|nr:alpha/beta hydrolase [Sedimentibacter sp. zth1]QSX05149.1 alpha/beta hydrolase [Sedimentibacter sp. zth1]